MPSRPSRPSRPSSARGRATCDTRAPLTQRPVDVQARRPCGRFRCDARERRARVAASRRHHMPETVVVIPTYNECDNVVTLVPEVLRTIDCDVVIVDDDSPDGTGTVVRTLAERDPRIHLVNHRPRRGIGPAYKDGFRAALALEPDFVVQMDADFSHSPAMLPEMVRLAAENDLVLGSRYVRGIT